MTKRQTAAQAGRQIARGTSREAHKQARPYRAKVTVIANRTTSGIKCELVDTGDTVYVSVSCATSLQSVAVNDAVWLRRMDRANRNEWMLLGLAKTTGGSYLPVLRGDIVTTTTRVTTTYTALSTDEVIFCDTDGGAFTLTLPAGVEGKHYKIINCGSAGLNLTVDGDGAETVYGETTQLIFDGSVIDIHYNATEGWW